MRLLLWMLLVMLEAVEVEDGSHGSHGHRRRGRLGLLEAAVVVLRVCLGAAAARPALRLLLGLHAAVLEPYLDLPLGQAQVVRDLDPAPAREVPVVVELLLQLEGLESRVCLTCSFWTLGNFWKRRKESIEKVCSGRNFSLEKC